MSSDELSDYTGITLRQIQWWCEAGILKPEQSGHARWFDETEAALATIVRDLRRKGVPLARIRRLGLRQPQGDFLVLTPRSRLWCRTKEDVLRCVVQATCPCQVVGVEQLRRLYV